MTLSAPLATVDEAETLGGRALRPCSHLESEVKTEIATKRRISSLDGLRGIAALAVVLFHYNIFYLPQAKLPYIGQGYLGVDLFFLMSGFVMAHVYGRE